MVAWSDFRTHIKRSVLKDIASTPTWSNDVLLDCLGWALDMFCAHTAVVTSTVVEPVSDQTAYALPLNLFESPEAAGAVYTISGSTRLYMKPWFYYPETDPSEAYWVEDDNIVFAEVPASDVYLRYYAYWTKPVDDDDEITLPRWALPAIANLVGWFAMSPESRATSNLKNFAEDPEKGTPLDNANTQQQNQYMKIYQQIIFYHHPQNRALFLGAP